jgi:general secretion pathway protein C
MELGRSGSTAVGDASSSVAASDGSVYHQTVDYRTGLQAVKSDGRISGFALKPKAALPRLEQAGLRPGDILLAVNGQALQSEEKVLELANEIASSRTAEFEFTRGGRKMTASLEVK